MQRQRLTTLAGVFSAAASLAIASSASAQASRDPNLVLWHSPDGRYWITFHAWTTNAWLYKSISTTVKGLQAWVVLRATLSDHRLRWLRFGPTTHKRSTSAWPAALFGTDPK